MTQTPTTWLRARPEEMCRTPSGREASRPHTARLGRARGACAVPTRTCGGGSAGSVPSRQSRRPPRPWAPRGRARVPVRPWPGSPGPDSTFTSGCAGARAGRDQRLAHASSLSMIPIPANCAWGLGSDERASAARLGCRGERARTRCSGRAGMAWSSSDARPDTQGPTMQTPAR